MLLIGGGARSRAYGQVLAALAGRPVEVASEEEFVARGAAAQATAVLDGSDPAAVVAAWRPVTTRVVEPDRDLDVAEIRGRYGQLRDSGLGETGSGLVRDCGEIGN